VPRPHERLDQDRLRQARRFAVTVGVQDFDFMGGSLGMAAGEAVVKGLELAVEKQTPFIMFAASGGARMQEGVLSLMQMPRHNGRGARCCARSRSLTSSC